MKIFSNTAHVSRVGGLITEKFKKYLRMDKNERLDDYSQKVINKFKKNLTSEDIVNYPNEQNLINSLAKYLKVKKNKILITPGSDAGLKYIFETFVDKKTNVASLSPSYAMFEFYCQLYKCKISKILYNKEFNVDLKDIKDIINQNPKLIYVANPNQPSGTSLKKKYLKNIIDLSQKKNCLVIIDEAYIDFSKHGSVLNLVNKYKNLFILRTFSKGFGSAGLRVGYIVSNPKNIIEVNKVRPLHNINSIGIKFSSFLLKNRSIVKTNILNINYSKSMLYKFCKKNNLSYLESDTNFVNIFFEEKKCREIQKFLRNKKILVRIRKYEIKNKKLFSVRVSLGHKKITKIFIKKFQEYLKINEKKN
ncbi:MAG: hypothetical protein CMI90_07155 [Pelagibacteraceae bacterium]|nr:hypothetical protein [Pelagibacteraceae bacterium]|tara:strand:+ start:1508 stop:2596 length:1089 start_codon:yes stop_codon:yes gene_type:complete